MIMMKMMTMLIQIQWQKTQKTVGQQKKTFLAVNKFSNKLTNCIPTAKPNKLKNKKYKKSI